MQLLRRFPVVFVVLFLISACTQGNVIENKSDTLEINKSVEVMYFGAKAQLKVTNIVEDFFPEGDVLNDPREIGNKFIKVDVEFENIGDKEFDMNFTSFHLDTASEQNVTESFLINDSNVDDHLESAKLAPGAMTKGSLYFEVSQDDKVSEMVFVYEGYDKKFVEYKIELK